MNGRSAWTAPHYATLAGLLLLALVGIGILHSNTRVMARFDALESQIGEVKQAVAQRPVVVAPAAAPGGGAGAASTAPAAKPVPPQGDWYIQGQVGEPETLNYIVTSGYLTQNINKYTHKRLIELDLDHPPAVIPGLAVSWDVSADKLTYTYHLRSGVQFSDGEPFSADDVMFTYQTVMDPAVNGHYVRSGLVDVEKVERVDDLTIRVKYKKPYWKGLLAFGYSIKPYPKHWYEREIPKFAKEKGIEKWAVVPGQPGFGEVFNQMRDIPPGTGPYMYKPGISWKPRESITVFQNPLSWEKQEAPWTYNLAALQWRFVHDRVAMEELLRKGDIDVITVDHDTWADNYSQDPVIAKVANHYVYDHTGLAYGLIVWNCRKSPFDDARVRRAMTMLMDRPTILREMDRGNGRIASCITKPTYPEYSQDIEPWPFDPEKARALLHEAGWRDSTGDGVLDRDGKDFAFEFKYPSGYPPYRRYAAMLRDACTRVGIRMSENPVEWSVFLEQYLDQNFQAVSLGVSNSDPWLDPFEEWHSSQDVPRGNNTPGWRNPKADRLMEAMREEFDAGKRAEMFHEFNRLFHEDQPITQLIHPLVGVLVNKRFEDVTIRPTGLQMLDFWVKPENQKHR